VDIAQLYRRRSQLQNALDFGALAGSGGLPAQGATAGNAAKATALQVVLDNMPGLPASKVSVTFRCIVTDTDRNGIPDDGQVPYVCGPATGTWTTGWTQRGTRVIHVCDPAAGDKCNAIVTTANDTVDYTFAPILGFDDGGTGTVSAAGCTAGCGAGTGPLDIVLVFDRTGSMSDADMTNAKSAALAMLGVYDSSQHKVGLSVLPYGQTSNPCDAATSQVYPKTDRTWEAVPMTFGYLNSDRSLNTSNALVQTINGLNKAPSSVTTNLGRSHTDLGDPLDAAQQMLENEGRSTVRDIIILFTDGEANQPNNANPCSYAVNKATNIKNKDTEIYTIAYNVANAKCTSDTGGSYKNVYATTFLADVATSSTDDQPGGCAATENTDRDHYFCRPGNADLAPVFRTVGTAAMRTSSLVDFG
jgi:hypothetical protein